MWQCTAKHRTNFRPAGLIPRLQPMPIVIPVRLVYEDGVFIILLSLISVHVTRINDCCFMEMLDSETIQDKVQIKLHYIW